MKEMVYCSHRDSKADAISMNRNPELPVKTISGSETPYKNVLQSMRNQEMLFYSDRNRSGY